MDKSTAQRAGIGPGPAAAGPGQVPRGMRRVYALEDLEPLARRHLPRPIFGYVSGASETNTSLDDNRAAFAEYGFVPRVLRDVSGRSPRTELFGRSYGAPFGIAPMGMSAITAYRGDRVLAAAATAADIPMIVSGSALTRLEDLKAIAPGAWFQAYLPGDPDRIEALVDRVARAGYEHLVLTVDTQVRANRENNLRTGFTTPLRPGLRLAWDGLTHPRWTVGTLMRTLVTDGMPHFENSFATRGAPIIARNVERDFTMRDHLDWSHFRAIRRQWKGRLIVKGIISPRDAALARDEGADGIIVSNHGGRQLDGTVAPLRMLEAARAAAPEITLMMDSGIRRGGDVLKAMALGAAFVFVGRPFLYAAALGGEAGVSQAIGLLATEVHRNMGMIGIDAPREMTREHLLARPAP